MIPVISIPSSLGGSHPGSQEGPLLIQQHLRSNVEWKETISPQPSSFGKFDQIVSVNQRAAQAVHKCVKENPFTMVITGDHSSAIGTWSGVATAIQQDLGLIWLDAHMDAHTMETTPSGNVHGMPLAALLGHGSPALTGILSPSPKVKPENLFIVGVRDYEADEKLLLDRLGVRVYYMEEVQARGISAVLSEIQAYFQKKKIAYGITLDIDFFDPEEMSATGTPAENGACPVEFMDAWGLLESYPPIVFEFVEFNPPNDTNGKSLKWVLQILQRIIKGNICQETLATAK